MKETIRYIAQIVISNLITLTVFLMSPLNIRSADYTAVYILTLATSVVGSVAMTHFFLSWY